MHDAYDDLTEDTKKKIEGLKAVHVYQSKYSPRPLGQITEESRRKMPPPGIHPLVRTHPENGRRALFLNPVRMAPTAPIATCTWGRVRSSTSIRITSDRPAP